METTYNSNTFNTELTGAISDPSGIATAPFSLLTDADAHYFANATKIIHIWAVDNHAIIRFSFRRDVLTWQPPIVIRNAPQSQDFYHSAQAFQIVNFEIGAVAWYQVVGMW